MPKKNFFITGMPKSGKTTLIRRLVAEFKKRGLKVGGFISPDETEHGTREGFYVEDIETGKCEVLAAVDGDGPKISKYHVDIAAFESIALPAMRKISKYNVFIIDEIGRMELRSTKFDDLLDKVFESNTPVIASLHEDYVEQYAINGELLILTPTNREAVFMELLKKATEEYGKPKAKKTKKSKNTRKGKKIKSKKWKTTQAKKGKAKNVKAKKKTKSKPVGKQKNEPQQVAGPDYGSHHAHEEQHENQQEKRHSVFHKMRDLIGL